MMNCDFGTACKLMRPITYHTRATGQKFTGDYTEFADAAWKAYQKTDERLPAMKMDFSKCKGITDVDAAARCIGEVWNSGAHWLNYEQAVCDDGARSVFRGSARRGCRGRVCGSSGGVGLGLRGSARRGYAPNEVPSAELAQHECRQRVEQQCPTDPQTNGDKVCYLDNGRRMYGEVSGGAGKIEYNQVLPQTFGILQSSYDACKAPGKDPRSEGICHIDAVFRQVKPSPAESLKSYVCNPDKYPKFTLPAGKKLIKGSWED
jgi:hypothetical protein